MITTFILMLAAMLGLTEPRTVYITINVTSGGAGLTDIPLTIRDGFKDSYGATGQNGTLVITKRISPHQKWLAVLPIPELIRVGETPEEWTTRRTADMAKLSQHGYREHYRIDIVPDQSKYSLSIAVLPARTLRLRAMNGDILIPSATVSTGLWSSSTDTEADGRAELEGVTREAFDLYVTSGVDTVRVRVPAGTIGVDLGDVQVTPHAESSPVNITVTNLRRLSKTLVWIDEGVTLVSPDGKKIISLGTQKLMTDSTKDTTANDPPQKIPAGIWYVAPLSFVKSPAQLRLVERLVNGEGLTGIPTITAIAGEMVTLDFDAKLVEQAIHAP